ncbi:replication initiation factor domain-containing protein [Bacillus wiedmannii]|uniref:replication initiation factor domain-containing protein n=1 Tax=Bacillus wiedmannii TaxID=1890302 RepID=UPI0007CB6FDD|nr:replication initiation factor domain-containing protein [Bacillus wiedmannii]OAK32596.1 hypothetical protein A6284_28340 [Bacillus wiedmannii]HDR7642648.1 replication initiation factor domain-containing protein [Bacillus wiedmannii]
MEGLEMLLVENENDLLRAVEPPTCNTGVQTPLEEGLNPCVDWFQVTFKKFQNVTKIYEVLGMDSDLFIELGYGNYGYKKCVAFSNIKIYYDGREDMGVHLQMSGQGCREYEHFGGYDWITLTQTCLGAGGQFTRYDLAIDDVEREQHKVHFTIASIKRRVAKGELVSKFKESDERRKRDIKSGETKGESVYFGSEKSSIRIRMYDKLAQMKDEGTEGIRAWNRTEIQARDERAQKIAELIAFSKDETFGVIAKGILKHYLRFTIKGKDSHRHRWKTAPFWEKFLGNVDALKLTIQPKIKTIETTHHWLKKSVSSSLATIYTATGGNMKAIEDIVKEGVKKINKNQKNMINAYKKEIALFNKNDE